ncbi:hypothetical protein LXL04_013392 [Taraxacum kok-saghyz]
MATKVQSKTYFPGSMMDLNNGFCNSMWDPYHDDRTPASEKNQYYNSFMMMQAMDGYSGYAKEQMRQTMLKQDSIFRHQLEELHRLYKRQRDLMNELTMKQQYNHSKSSTNQRRVIDLELPPDVYEENEEKQQPVENVHKLADLNEPVNMEEPQPQPPSFPPTNSTLWYGNGESNKPVDQIPRKRTIFGVELCERSHTTTPIDSSQNLEKKLPSWLMVKPHTSNEQQTKGKETTIYQMNLESLQHHSHQFFNKSEIITNPKSETDNNNNNNHQGFITKILGVPIIDMKDSVKENGKVNNLRHQIDLNLTLDEQEGPTSTSYIIPESVVKIASMEIDLEAPPTDTHSDDVLMESDDHLVKSAAEAIMSISSEPPLAADATAAILRWFAEVVAFDDKKDSENVNSDEESITIVPEGMDYFEYMTLKIHETKEKYDSSYKPIEEENQESGLLRKRTTTRKGQGKRGRQRKDFQRDVLPGIVSLSRREVTEDIQTFEDAFTGIGVSWQSKRKVSGKNGRGRRRLATPPPVEVVQSVCREEKGLSGWGKRTRRLPRQRCQNGGSHQSLALKC